MIVAAKGVQNVQWRIEGDTAAATATVRSSGANTQAYCCTVHPLHMVSCACMDFRSRGGLCQHLRAAFIEV